MDLLHFCLTLVKIITALTGAYFLYHEVAVGHRVEKGREIVSDLELLRSRHALFTRGLYKDFLIATYVDVLDFTLADATELFKNSTDDELKIEVDKYGADQIWNNVNMKKLEINRNLIKRYTNETAVETRRISLRLGYWLIVVSGIIELLDVLRESHYIFS